MNKKLDKRLASLFLRIYRKKLIFKKRGGAGKNYLVTSPFLLCTNARDPTTNPLGYFIFGYLAQ